MYNKPANKTFATNYARPPMKRRRPASRLSKRWYIDAAVPKAVPFIGGATFKAGSGSLTKQQGLTM